jgi:hypothetical protein
MFPLHQKQLPASAEELRAALERGLQGLVRAPGKIVSVRESRFPHLEEIAINLSGAQVRPEVPQSSLKIGPSAAAFSASRLMMNGEQMSLGPASLNLNIDASDVLLRQTQDEKGDVILLLHRASEGRLVLSLKHTDLEALIAQIAKSEASKQGVTIEDVRLRLRSLGPRSLEGEALLRARKLFIQAKIRLSANLEIDDQLVAQISDLTCTGEGTIATLACSVLAPHLQKIEGRAFELMALPLGEVRLRDVKLEAGDAVTLTAEFGSTVERQIG